MRTNGDSETASEASRTSPALARIGGALGVPASAFLAPGSSPDGIEGRERAALLDLVRIYLDRAGPDARGRLVEALGALLDAETAGRPPAKLSGGPARRGGP